MSGSVGSAIFTSGMVENMGGCLWNRVAIAFRSKVIFTSGLHHRHFEFPTSTDVGPCPPMSGDVGSVTGNSVVFENVEVAF